MSDTAPRPAATPLEGAAKAALAGFSFVTPEVRKDLRRFVDLLRDWQRVHNLVAPSTLDDVWGRHVADSLQLVGHAPPFGDWVDLGSGAGFPGLVAAVAAKGNPAARFTLVEANHKKAAFLRAAIAATGARAAVAAERIESHAALYAGRADVVSARALAPLVSLLPLARPYLHERSVMILPKGQDFVHEIEEASKSWDFDVVDFPSVTDPRGRVLLVRHLRPKAKSP